MEVGALGLSPLLVLIFVGNMVWSWLGNSTWMDGGRVAGILFACNETGKIRGWGSLLREKKR